MGSAAVHEVVPVYRGDNDIVEPHEPYRAAGVRGLFGIQPAFRVARIDGAETAGTRADRAQHHDRRGTRIPAFADVRAHGLFANGTQPMLAHGIPGLRVADPGGHLRSQPFRLLAADDGRGVAAPFHAVLDRREARVGLVLAATLDNRNAAKFGFAVAHQFACRPDAGRAFSHKSGRAPPATTAIGINSRLARRCVGVLLSLGSLRSAVLPSKNAHGPTSRTSTLPRSIGEPPGDRRLASESKYLVGGAQKNPGRSRESQGESRDSACAPEVPNEALTSSGA